MHLNIVANSIGFLLAGVVIIVGAVLTALVLQAWWPLLFVLVGLAFTCHIERDPVSVKFAELARRKNCGIKRFEKKLYGVVGDFFVVGTVNAETLTAVESLLGPTDKPHVKDAFSSRVSGDGVLGVSGGDVDLPTTPPSDMQCWRLADIDRITFTSNGTSLTIVRGGVDYVQRYQHTSVRDAVLKVLKPAVKWQIDKQFRKIFQLNVLSAIGCLLVMFFAMALVFTVLGLVQPKQLPLADWNDLNKMRGGGKGRGVMLIWVVLCESYLFLINNLHAGVVLLLGAAVTIAFGIVLYATQWTKVADTTWLHPNTGR